jgi:hypothetical protein
MSRRSVPPEVLCHQKWRVFTLSTAIRSVELPGSTPGASGDFPPLGDIDRRPSRRDRCQLFLPRSYR